MATKNHVMGTRKFCRRPSDVLSQEEIALLHVLRSSGGPLTTDAVAERTGMDAGLARLGMALLEHRGL